MHKALTAFILCIVLIAIWLVSSSVQREAPSFVMPEQVQMLTGDYATLSSLPTDVTHWKSVPKGTAPVNFDQFWLKATFVLPQKPGADQGLYLSLHAASSLYWNGQLLGTNGVVGNTKAREIPGMVDRILYVPRDLLTEENQTLLIQASTFHNAADTRDGGLWIVMGDYDELYQRIKGYSLPSLLMTGLLFMLALFSLYLFVTTEKDVRYLLFGLLCLAMLLLIIAEAWRSLWNYPYSYHQLRMQLVLLLSAAVSLCLLLYIVFSMSLPMHVRRTILVVWAVCGAGIIAFEHGYDTRSLYVFVCGLLLATGVCLYQAWKKDPDAWPLLIGLILFAAPMAINIYAFMDSYFFVSFAILVALHLSTLITQMQSRKNQLAQQAITASRLKLELLKRQLQPHFILNTLTAVEEWIEQSPAQAVNFVQALAEEFRQMAALAEHTMVSLEDEVALCKTYLKVMSFRRDTALSLETDQMIPKLQIPPGIILTLCENAITHNRYHGDSFTFSLRHTLHHGIHQLDFTAPAVNQPREPIAYSGLGNRYIRMRLTESFGKKWFFSEKIHLNQWLVCVQFPLTVENSEEQLL